MAKAKQVIVVARKFHNGRGGMIEPRVGKMMAQAGHASIAFLVERINQEGQQLKLSQAMIEWMRDGQRKIVLQVETCNELLELCQKAIEAGLESHLITDSGYTVFKGETITALAIGPDWSSKIDPITAHLRLM